MESEQKKRKPLPKKLARFVQVPVSFLYDVEVYDVGEREGRKLRMGDKMVYITLLQHADKKGQCYVSELTIADYIGWSERSVRRSIKTLKAAGYVDVEERGMNRANLYTVKSMVGNSGQSANDSGQIGLSDSGHDGRQKNSYPKDSHIEEEPVRTPAKNDGLPVGSLVARISDQVTDTVTNELTDATSTHHYAAAEGGNCTQLGTHDYGPGNTHWNCLRCHRNRHDIIREANEAQREPIQW